MRDDDGVDHSIHLEPIEPTESTWPSRPFGAAAPSRRKIGPYLLIAGAIVLSLSAGLAVLATVANRINGNSNVTVASQRDRASERAEAVEVFRDYDARKATSQGEDAERAAIDALFARLSEYCINGDDAGYRAEVDFDRMLKRIELTGNLWNYNGLERRFLRTELKNSLEVSSFWNELQVVGVRTPADDRESRIIYAFGTNAPGEGAELMQFRFWIARNGDSWKVYDLERLDLGLSRSREWGLYVKYHNTPEMAGFDRWSTLATEANESAAEGKRADAKEKMHLAEAEMCPAEFADYRWLLSGYHWMGLGEASEAERCFAQIQQPDDIPGVYFSLMDAKLWEDPAAALENAERFERAIGPHPVELAMKARLLERLHRNQDAIETWQEVLRLKPDDAEALTQLFLSLPTESKSAFKVQLDSADDPVKLASEIASSVGYQDIQGLKFFVDYLEQRAPGSPAACSAAALEKQLKGQYAEAAALYRRAYEAEKGDERAEYVSAYLKAMTEAGDVGGAARIIPNPEEAISRLISGIEEGEISLTDDEHRQILDIYAERCPESLQPVMCQADLALANERYADAERLARSVLARLGGKRSEEASVGGDVANNEKSDEVDEDYVRNSMTDTLAAALCEQGQLREAYESAIDRRHTFTNLTRLAIQGRRWDDARELLTMHRQHDSKDPRLHFVEGELAAHDQQWDAAIRHFQEGRKLADENTHWEWNDRLSTLCIKNGRWADFYRGGEDRELAFEKLALQLIAERDWAAFAELMHEHQLDFPGDPRIAKYQAEAAWDQEDHLNYIRFATEVLACRDESILPSYEREDIERRIVSAKLRDPLVDARELLESVRPADAKKARAVIAAATGDLPNAKRLAREFAAAMESCNQLYWSEDAGRIFLDPQFRDLQQDYPVSISYGVASTVAVYLFDKPWKVESSEVAAAFAKLGGEPGPAPVPLNTLGGRTTRGLALNFDEGSIWIVCGEGKFDAKWKLDGDQGQVAAAVNNGQSWLAVGTAAWTERGRKRLGPLARRVAQALAKNDASAFCASRYEGWNDFFAFEPAADQRRAWLAAGSLVTFANEGLNLESTEQFDDAVAERRVERSLRNAVKEFEATPNAKLEVWLSPCTHPMVDVLRVNVSKVERFYGSLDFKGTLATSSILIPELVVGLPMDVSMYQICAWQLNDDGPMYRQP